VLACDEKIYFNPNYRGSKVDLGVCPPADYRINLKTNNIVIATTTFNVFLPDALEQQLQLLHAERARIQQTSDQIQQLHDEIERERLTLNNSDPAAVAAYNAKAANHNQLALKNQAEKAKFNATIADFNRQVEKLVTQADQPVTFPWAGLSPLP
jgi:hypothetical protein